MRHPAAKFGDTTRSRRCQATGAREAVGLQFRFDLIERLPNTRRSHLLIAHAGRRGLQGEVMERIMQAYFEEGCDIGDVEELVRLGVEVGLSSARRARRWFCARARTGWSPPSGTPAVLGITGVPTFIFDRQYSVSGAQDVARSRTS